MAARLILDSPASGAWNMAVDEALAESVGRAGQGGNLRFYRWDPATLSLGYFQHLADRRHHAASRCCALVRRASGGGAIVHDHELTYSLTWSVSRARDGDLVAYYRALHDTLVLTLRDFGVIAHVCEHPRPVAAEPFLCFQRRTVGDVLIGSHKVAGSAQRRYRNVLLQHGSVLLRRSEHAPELPGIEDLSGLALPPEELSERWQARIAERLGADFCNAGLEDHERAWAEQQAERRHACENWLARR